MEAILRITLSNTLLAAVLALAAMAVSRIFRRPALSHALWLIVLLKLITPPLWNVALPLMPAETGKRSEYQTAVDAGDPLSAHFHDYDWADEVLHAQIGRRWIRHEGITVEQAAERAASIHARTWASLDQYKHLDPQAEWWDDFVRRVLGKPSALKPEERGELKIVAE